LIDAEKLLPGDLAEYRRKVKARLRNFRLDPLTFDLYRSVREIDDEDPDLMSVEETRTLLAIEEGFSVYFAIFAHLENLLEVPALRADAARDRKLLEHRLTFASLYALFVAASVIAARTAAIREELPREDVRSWPLDLERVAFDANEIRTFNNVVSRFLVDLHEKKADNSRVITGSADFVCLTHDFFRGMAERCLRASEAWLDLKPVVEGRHFIFDGVSVSGFTLQAEDPETVTAPGDTWEQMVGNRELKTTLRGVADKILLYDPRTRRNPARELGDFARTILLYGRPGTGKTMAIGALINELTGRAKQLGKPFRAVLIGSDVKDKYFGESVKNLKRKLSELHRGDRICLVAIEDIDLMLASRDDINVNAADKDLLHELMNSLEGVASRDLGNAVIVATTNDIKGVEGALAERLQENPLEVRGPETAEDFADLFRIKLRRGLPEDQGGMGGYVRVADKGSRRKPGWREIGEACLACGFTGRPVKNICKRLMTVAGEFPMPEDVYGLEGDACVERLRPLYRPIDGAAVMAEVERYRTHSQAHEEALRAERVRRRKEALLEELRAGTLARAELQEE
jgi:hypothetical protein